MSWNTQSNWYLKTILSFTEHKQILSEKKAYIPFSERCKESFACSMISVSHQLSNETYLHQLRISQLRIEITCYMQEGCWDKNVVFADVLYGTELRSSLWGRTSLLKMIWCTTNNKLVNWHFLATYTMVVLKETQIKYNCEQSLW